MNRLQSRKTTFQTKQILIAGTALVLMAAPAHAQLLGGNGGGLGGVLRGTIDGAGSIGSVRSLPADSLRGATPSAADVSADARSSGRADRRSGRVEATGEGSGSLSGGLTGALDGPAGTTDASSQASASGSGGGSASAQLVGTDAMRSTAGSLAGEARSTGQAAAQQGKSAAQSLLHAGGSLAGSAQGSASGAASNAAGPLAATGSLAAQGQEAFAVERGTAIFDKAGARIGRVREVVVDGRGQVEQLLVRVDGQRALLPAGNFHANGHGLVSAMGEGQIKQVAEQQEEAR